MSHRLFAAAVEMGGLQGSAARGEASVLEAEAGLFPPGVKAAVFDVVGTLVDPSPSVAVAYQQAARRHGVEVAVAELAPRFGAAWTRQEAIDAVLQPAHSTSRQREHQRWHAIVRDVFAGLADSDATDAIFQDLWQHFALPTAWQATAHGPELVAAALEAGLQVALASNFDERLFEVAAAVEPLVQAAHVFPSSELGWRKPAAAFFRAVEARLGMRSDELVMFGDNPELDIAAARRAGWHAVLLPAKGSS
jgi:putative hydrolase of the HAD superfamily